MSALALLLFALSVAVLTIGTRLYKSTASKAVLINVIAGSLLLFYASDRAASQPHSEWAAIMPFFAAVLFAGRALGCWLGIREGVTLQTQKPIRVLTVLAVLCLFGTAAARLMP
jgi:hypothetical protein